MITKIVISPNNKKAIHFLEDLSKRKEEIKKKLIENAAKRNVRTSKLKH